MPAAALVLALGASPARAMDGGLDFAAQDLAAALRQLAARGGVELIFDAAPMAGRRSAPVHGARTPEIALRDMLAGSGFYAKRSSAGVLVITAVSKPMATEIPPLGENTAVAEVLVVGSRSLNTAIRRSEDDIQPYSILDADLINTVQPETIEDFLRARDPHNVQAGTMAQAPVANGGAIRSRIDFGGLGTGQTLVLVDGRRMPSIPGQDIFQQGDINGIPPGAIERIESLTSTAGGIYGPGATGGVLNVVLKRDYEGGEAHVSGGLSARGDAGHYRVEGTWGHAFFGDATRLMLTASHTEDDGLAQGRRDIAVAARQALIDHGAAGFLVSASLNVWTSGALAGAPGFATASTTYKGLGQSLANGGLTALIVNRGKLDADLSADGQGSLQSLLSRGRTDSLIFNLRQEITPRIEAFVDVLYVRSHGEATGPGTLDSVIALARGAGGNPFDGAAQVSFPTPGLVATSTDDLRTERMTAGAIVRLGQDWRAALDVTVGRVTDVARTPNLIGVTGDPMMLDLFDTGSGVGSLYGALLPDSTERQVNALTDLNLRLSGPILSLPAGAATMTILGELRREHQSDVFVNYEAPAQKVALFRSVGPQSQSVGSAYAELRAPLTGNDAPRAIRGLELQLAGRFDATHALAPGDGIPAPYGIPDQQGRARTFAFTTGLRLAPVEGLMLRASVATGYLPPTSAQLLQAYWQIGPQDAQALNDPVRGGPASSQAIGVKLAGSPDQTPERARTVSAGFVATPTWAPGLRLSLDYTRIDKTHEITRFAVRAYQFFLDHQARFPDRVTHAALTAADIAAGYAAGEVTDIDTSDLNIGRSVIQTVDLDARYAWRNGAGAFQLYARATWEPDFRRRDNPDQGAHQTAGYIDGPLALRGNAGLDWRADRWRADLNVQAYAGYKVTYDSRDYASASALNLAAQGTSKIPAQAYADLTLAYLQPRLEPGGLGAVEYRLGVRNLLDARPPLVLIKDNPALYYSAYGDPRGRRFEVSVTQRF